MKKYFHFQKASTVVEVVIMLPLFLLGMLFILWIGYVVNTKNTLISAVENGVRLASTRGKAGLFQGEPVVLGTNEEFKSGAIKEIDTYHLSKNKNSLGVAKDLLVHNISQDDFENVYSYYVNRIFSPVKEKIAEYTHTVSVDTLKLSDLPPFYTYAIAYTTKAMRMGVGDSIRYPCDPRAQDGDNCLLCRPVNPKDMSDNPIDNKLNDDTDDTIFLNRVAIRCDYKPGGFLIKPLLSMMSFLTGDGNKENNQVMTHFTYFDSYEECGFQEVKNGNGENYSRYCCNDVNFGTYCF